MNTGPGLWFPPPPFKSLARRPLNLSQLHTSNSRLSFISYQPFASLLGLNLNILYPFLSHCSSCTSIKFAEINIILRPGFVESFIHSRRKLWKVIHWLALPYFSAIPPLRVYSLYLLWVGTEKRDICLHKSISSNSNSSFRCRTRAPDRSC